MVDRCEDYSIRYHFHKLKKQKNTRSCTDNDIDFAEFSFSPTGILHDRENPWERPKAQGTTAQLIHEFKQKTRTYLNHRTIVWALVENHQWVCDREGSHHRYQMQLQTTACRFGKIKIKKGTQNQLIEKKLKPKPKPKPRCLRAHLPDCELWCENDRVTLAKNGRRM